MLVINKSLSKIKKNPPIVIGISFALVILIGSLLLALPRASSNGESVGFINALFTASSATCVTGLTINNTAADWSVFGKVVIITLIQIGGLGTMTLVALVGVLTGKKIGLQERMLIKEQLNSETMTGLVRLIIHVIILVFSFELIGALILSLRFIPMYGLGQGIAFSLFHSISAFCNAGFDLLGDSLEPFNNDVLLNVTIMLLVIGGGLGFSVYFDIFKKRRFTLLTIHSKLALTVTATLLIGGTITLLILEFTNSGTIGNMALGNKVLASAFQSTIARTAGFYSVNIAALRESSVFILILLMFIGGSPGSTAGGLKTTTFGLLIASTIATIKDEEDIVLMKKTMGKYLVRKAFAMAFICIIVLVIMTLLITIVENGKFPFLDILFETTSAFATVGLTRGITMDVTEASKIILSITMFLGRVGPTTLALGLGKRTNKKSIKYVEGSILIG